MRIISCLIVAVLLAASAALAGPLPSQQAREALVSIWVDIGQENWEFGTGFFISEDGRILTCYHVVEGARKIEVHHRQPLEVIVEAISPDHDLAILQVKGLKQPVPYLKLVERLPARREDEELRVFGHAAQVPNQQFRGRMTRRDFVLSREIVGRDRRPIFNLEDVRLIWLDLTVYGGLSGGPVLSEEGVIGVFSGSFQEGGSLSWAIPSEYARIEMMQRVGGRLRSEDWPQMRLMNAGWRSVRARSRAHGRMRQQIGRYYDALDEMESLLPAIAVQAGGLAQIMELMRIALSKNEFDPDALEALWKPVGDRPEQLMQTMMKMDEAFQRMKQAASNLVATDQQQRGAATQRNVAFVRELEVSINRARDKFVKHQALLEEIGQEEQSVLKYMRADDTQDILRLVKAVESFCEKLASTRFKSEMRDMLDGYRELGTAADRLSQYEFDPDGQEWEFHSPLGVKIAFTPDWSILLDMTAEEREQSFDLLKSYGFSPLEIFWHVRQKEEKEPIVAMVGVHARAMQWSQAELESLRQNWSTTYQNVRVERTRVTGGPGLIVRGTRRDPPQLRLAAFLPATDRTVLIVFEGIGSDPEKSAQHCLDLLRNVSLPSATQRPMPVHPASSRGDAVHRGKGYRIRPPIGFEHFPGHISEELMPHMPADLRKFKKVLGPADGDHFIYVAGVSGAAPDWHEGDSIYVGLSDFRPREDMNALAAEYRILLPAMFGAYYQNVKIRRCEVEELGRRNVIVAEAVGRLGGLDLEMVNVLIFDHGKAATLSVSTQPAHREGFLQRVRWVAQSVQIEGPIAQSAAALQSLEARARKGDARAFVELGRAYAPRDAARSVRYFQRAAQSQDRDVLAEACGAVGAAYYEGRGVSQSRESALPWFKRGAAAGDAVSMRYLGVLAAEGITGEADFIEAARWYAKASGAGDAEAARRLAAAYREGRGVVVDSDRARLQYSIAAHRGDGEAMYRLGRIYESGTGVDVNIETAAQWYQKAATAGHAEAMAALGDLVKRGQATGGVETAVRWYRQAAEAGSATGALRYGYALEKGDGVRVDLAEAFYWYSTASQRGEPEATRNLGVHFRDGIGRPRDYNKARAYFELAADRGLVAVYYDLGRLYEYGLGVERSYDRAKTYYKLGIESGSGLSMHGLAELHASGKLGRTDKPEAWFWWWQGAKLDDAYCHLKLAQCYESGFGTIADDEKAARHYRRAAELGSTWVRREAGRSMGHMHWDGRGVAKDEKLSFQWFEWGANQGDLESRVWVGWFHEKGRGGVAKNPVAAAQHYRAAADAGSAMGMYHLGLLYENGAGVAKDINTAKAWYQRAAEANYQRAKEALERLGSP